MTSTATTAAGGSTHVVRIRHDLHLRHAVVAQVADLGTRMRRLTLTLDEGAPAVPWVPLAVGMHLKLCLPHPETGELVAPHLVDGRPVPREDGKRPLVRDYTVRAVPDDRHLVLEMVVHGTGPASAWAAAAAPGARVALVGPRGAEVEPDGYRRYLCLADESALPAAARWLEELPEGAELHVAIQVPDADAVTQLPDRPGTTVTFLVGSDHHLLAAHLDTLSPGAGDYVWAAGETTAMLAVRRRCVAAELARQAWSVDGYWKVGVAGRDHHAPLED